jgi:hypothetical protein
MRMAGGIDLHCRHLVHFLTQLRYVSGSNDGCQGVIPVFGGIGSAATVG